MAFDDGDLLDFSALSVGSATEGILLPGHATTCAAATGEGQLCWDIDSEDLWIGNGDDAVHIGGNITIKSIWWGANAMVSDGTQCGTATAVSLITGGPDPLTIACADDDSGTIGGTVSMPDNWNGDPVTFTLVLGQILASTDAYVMDFEAQCISSDEAFLAFAGTGERAAAITLTAADDMLEVTTLGVTLNGTTCAGGDVVAWQGAIDETASGADIGTQAVIVGVKMEYPTSGAE